MTHVEKFSMENSMLLDGLFYGSQCLISTLLLQFIKKYFFHMEAFQNNSKKMKEKNNNNIAQ